MTYNEQLLTENWKLKRLIILKRDKHRCTKCRSIKFLQVHHKKYISGRMCWDYPNYLLVTLCKVCHEKTHKETKIQIIKNKRIKPIKLNSKQKRYKKLYPNMFNFYNKK